jgi:hypothetical protein
MAAELSYLDIEANGQEMWEFFGDSAGEACLDRAAEAQRRGDHQSAEMWVKTAKWLYGTLETYSQPELPGLFDRTVNPLV